MASPSLTRSLNLFSNNGAATALKMADIYIRQNTNDSGQIKDPAVYQYAINTYLAPYMSQLSVQQRAAEYTNNVKKLSVSQSEDNYSVTDFTQKLQSILFVKDTNYVRDPLSIVGATSQRLDGMTLQLDAAIKSLEDSGKSADSLINLRDKVDSLADDERALYNNLTTGTTNPNLDGYGYFVKTNPVDGSLVGAAVLPVSRIKDWVPDLDPSADSGMKRITSTVSLGNTKMPVYLNATKDAAGNLTARLGDNTWSDTDASKTGILEPVTGSMPSDGAGGGVFDISDSTKYPVGTFNLKPGQFARAVAGIGQDGMPATSFYYKGQDGKVYSLSNDAVQQFAQDPNMKTNLGRAVSIDNDDLKSLGVPTPMNDLTLQNEERAAIPPLPGTMISAAPPASFFEKAEGAVGNAAGAVGNFIGGVGNAIGSFFTRKQPTPQTAPQSSNGVSSAADVEASGAKFFGGQ